MKFGKNHHERKKSVLPALKCFMTQPANERYYNRLKTDRAVCDIKKQKHRAGS